MANIPENTDNPILRPVTRLETSTKVFGGAYIPDDEQQRGISNLQAIELAERDQYILSRVGEAEVEPSGDIPGDVGIASLDTSGKLPKAENTTGVVFTDDIQTLENKSIDKNANTVTCSPYEISTSQTLTPTKELNVVITDSVTLTLGNGPYAGYSLPITAQADSSVVFTGPGGSTTNNLLANQKITYTWRGSFWDSDAALAPVYIHATTTVSPSADINYVVDTASAVLTISDGVYSGQEVSVTAEAACSVTYKGINGTTTAPLAAYNRNELVWNGSYWLSTIGAVIEGRTASGSNFTYGGGIDVAVVPDSTETITEDGATLDPAAVSKFILNIDTEGATCSIDDGVTVGQIITLVNANENTVTVSYTGFDGNVETEEILGGNNESYIWSGTHWSSGVVTPDSVTTFGNKTIDAKDNTVKISPTTITTDTTITPTKEMRIVGGAAWVCVTLASSAPYVGYRLPICPSYGNYMFVKFTGSGSENNCVCLWGNSAVFIWTGSYWVVENGATFVMNNTAWANRPTGTKPSDWKASVSTYGVFTYVYVGTGDGDYDLPPTSSNMTVQVYSRCVGTQTAIAFQNYASTGYENRDVPLFKRLATSSVWSNHWSYFTGGGTGTVHTETTNFQNNYSGTVKWTVVNRVCYMQIDVSSSSSSSGTRYIKLGLPKANLDSYYGITHTGNYVYINSSGYLASGPYPTANTEWHATLVYPVATSWEEN